MIKTEAEYQECLKRLEEDRKIIRAQQEKLEELNLSQDQIELAMDPGTFLQCSIERGSGMV